MRAAFWMAIGLAVSVSALATGQDATVGNLGAPERWEIRGAATFTAEQVERALFRDVQFLLATHPLAPRRELAAAVERRIAAGYRKAGFAETQARAAIDEAARKIVVSIEEGRRYTCGDVQIAGGAKVLAGELRERLTRPYPPVEAVKAQFYQRGGERKEQWLNKEGQPVQLADAVWELGKPARLDDASTRQIGELVKHALAEFGYPFAQFNLSLDLKEEGTADVIVVIADEGPPAEIRDVEIAGAVKNSRPDLLAYLEIKPGELVTHRRRLELEQRLWESGRFIDQRVILVPPQNDAPARVRLELVEYPHAPPLSARLSREQECLLRARPWLTNFVEGGDQDFSFERESGGLVYGLVTSPRRGGMLTMGRAGPDGKVALLGGFLLSDSEIGLYALEQNFRLSSPPSQRVRLETVLSLSVNPEGVNAAGAPLPQNSKPAAPEDDKPKSPFLFGFGFQFRTLDEEETAAPVEVRLSVAPVFCVALAHEKGARASWEGHVMTIASDDLLLRIDARDGRVLELKGFDPAHLGGSPVFGIAPGEFERRREQILAASAASPNLFVPARPVTSLIAALAREDLWGLVEEIYDAHDPSKPPLRESLFAKLRVVRALAERDVLLPLDQAIVREQEKDNEKFDIPFEPDGATPGHPWGQAAVTVALPVAEQVFPRESWPWTICRETALTAAGRPNYLHAELDRIYASPEVGPLACLATASLLKLARMQGADAFAARGLGRLEAGAFVQDCAPFRDDSVLCGKCLRRVADVLRAFDEPEAQKLSRALLKEDAPILEAAARELRRDRSEPLDEAISRALAAAWNAGLRERVEAALRTYLSEDTFRIGSKP